MLFAHGENVFFALDDVHKADRHTDDERGAQTVFDLLGNGEQRGGRVADRQNRAGAFFCSLVHGGDGARGAAFFCALGDCGVCHEAQGFPIQLFETRLGNTCERHIRIGDDRGRR